VDVNKAVVIGIVGSGIIIGIIGILSLDSFSIIENNDESSEPILGEGDSELEPKPQGRDLSIELDEKMGLSAP
jgi:hypothetical protein